MSRNVPKVYAKLFSYSRLPAGIQPGCLHIVMEYIYLSDVPTPRSGKVDFITTPFASKEELEDQMKDRLKAFLQAKYPTENLRTKEIIGPTA